MKGYTFEEKAVISPHDYRLFVFEINSQEVSKVVSYLSWTWHIIWKDNGTIRELNRKSFFCRLCLEDWRFHAKAVFFLISLVVTGTLMPWLLTILDYFILEATIVPSLIIVGYLWQILERQPFVPHPWATPKRPILNRAKGQSFKLNLNSL